MKVVKAVKALITNGEGKILFMKEKTPSGREYYGFPGGRLEGNETEEQALRREVREETGLGVSKASAVGGYSFVMENGTRVECTVFECEVENPESMRLDFQDAAQEEITSFRWLSPEEFFSEKLPGASEGFSRFLQSLQTKRIL
ncbi:MAG: NUDIX hydrolase [Candidatus Norongarragalinales archaeon]